MELKEQHKPCKDNREGQRGKEEERTGGRKEKGRKRGIRERVYASSIGKDGTMY